MTEEERKLTIDYLEDMKEECVEGEGNERYPLPEWYMLNKVIKIIEQQPSENEEIIRVSKGALKLRTGRYVIYDVEWLKEHFNTTEAKIYGQTSEDCISRKSMLEGLANIAKAKAKSDAQKSLMGRVMFFTEHLPSVIPQPKTEWIPVKWHNITDEERQREGYPKEWLTMLDCPMPNDDEEILVTVKSVKCGLHVEKDVCYIDDGFSLDSGHDWIDDVVAWMPLPSSYQGEENG